jgi:hypothetical protein
LLTLFWSAKEAIFKWYGKGSISLKNNISLHQLFFESQKGKIDAHFIKDTKIDLKLEFRFFQKLCLVWVLK